MEGFPILTLITLTPLLGALVILAIPRENERTIKLFAILLSLIPLLLSLIVWFNYDSQAGTIQFTEVYQWIPTLNIQYRMGVDGLSVPMVFLTALLTVICLYYSSHVIKVRVKEYFFFFLLLEMGMMGVFTSLDFFLFYVFWEIGLVPMYFLIGIWGGKRREYAAIKFFLYTLTGSVLMLVAILAMFFAEGTFDIIEMAARQPFSDNFVLQSMAFWGIFAAFAIKVPLFPFHTWLPDAHVEAPTAGSVILAGVLLKLGCYGFLRVLLPIFPQAFQVFAPIVGLLALISIVYGALVSMAQWDLKKLIAYSSVNHMGFVILGIAAAAYAGSSMSSNPAVLDSATIAINGAIMQMFSHGIITGGLFLLVGMIYERTHTRDLKAFGGLATKVPSYYAVVLLTVLASLGLPGLSGFVAEFMVFRGVVAIMPLLAILGVLGVVVTAAFFLWKVIQGMFLGPLNEKWAGLPDMERYELLCMAPLIFFMLLFGLYPVPIINIMNNTVHSLLHTLSLVIGG
jgi:NADH-quinone oxidoreductase subunit M